MKSWRKVLALLLALALVVGMTACSGGGESSTSTPESSTSETSEPADESSEAEESSEEAEEPETDDTGTTTGSYPREESLYQGGQQWATPVSNNPMAANANYAAMANGDTGARELVWETLYM